MGWKCAHTAHPIIPLTSFLRRRAVRSHFGTSEDEAKKKKKHASTITAQHLISVCAVPLVLLSAAACSSAYSSLRVGIYIYIHTYTCVCVYRISLGHIDLLSLLECLRAFSYDFSFLFSAFFGSLR